MRSRNSGLAGIILSSALANGSIGLATALLPLRMKADGFSTSSIGFVGLGYGVGFVAAALSLTALVRGIGYRSAFLVLAASAALATAMLVLSTSVVFWAVLRAVIGAGLAGVMILVDSWIGAKTTAEDRGRTLAICYLANRTALMLSPLIITVAHSVADVMFFITAGAIFLSIAPFIGTKGQVPQTPSFALRDITQLFLLSPSAAIASTASGVIFGSLVSLSPVYGLEIGLSEGLSAAIIFVLQFGALAVQWPAGAFSDHVDRRWVILALIGGVGLGSVGLIISATFDSRWMAILSFLICGGSTFCIYPICIAHGCDLVPKEKIIQAVSALLLCWAIGLTVGPLPASLAMDHLGSVGLPYFSAIFSFSVLGLLFWRIKKFPRAVVHRASMEVFGVVEVDNK